MNYTYRDWFREVYQHTPHWKRVKALVRERAGGRCESCGVPGYHDVHHLTYKNLHFEDFHLDDLLYLCHDKCHPEADRIRREDNLQKRLRWFKLHQNG